MWFVADVEIAWQVDAIFAKILQASGSIEQGLLPSTSRFP